MGQFRRSISAATVLAGAGVITWSTVSAIPEPEVAAMSPRVVSVAVAPTANYGEVLAAAAVETLQQSFAAATTDVPELWNTVVDDWPDERLTGRNYSRVADMALMPLVPLVSGPLKRATTQVLTEQFPDRAEQIEDLAKLSDYALVRAIGPVVSAIGGAGEAHAGIFRPMTTGDVPGFLQAVVKAPSYVVDGLLHGGYGDIGPLVGRDEWTAPPGLLTPWGEEPEPRNIDGPIETETETETETGAESEAVSEAVSESEARQTISRRLVSLVRAPEARQDTAPDADADADADARGAAPLRRGLLARQVAEDAEEAGTETTRERTGLRDVRTTVRESVKKLTEDKKPHETKHETKRETKKGADRAAKSDRTKKESRRSDAD